jgi:hypothetical protein
MVNEDPPGFRFKLRHRLEPVSGDAWAAVGPSGTATGGCFSHPAGVLTFLGAAAEAHLADTALCRRSPDNRWWAEVQAPWQAVAPLIWTAGGRPFTGAGKQWTAVPLAGVPSLTAETESLDPTVWQPVAPVDLLAGTPLPPRRLISAASLAVIVPAALGRWVLRRTLALGIQVGIVPALRRPLESAGTEAGVLLLRLRVNRGTIPLSLVRVVNSLPYTLIAQPVAPRDGRLLVDIRYRPPLAASLLGDWIPDGEIWVLGGADTGHERLHLLGEESDGANFLAAPELPLRSPATPAEVNLPAPLPVRLVAHRSGSTGADAVLLDDAELHWLRPFLAGRPVAERAFLLPGAGRHLLLAPGGLAERLPLGIPMTRIGPGGLYLEIGLDFHPPLPEGARIQAFGLTEDRVVAVAGDGAYGFDNRRLTPAWTLWVGAAPPVQEGLSPNGRQLLARVAATVRQAEAEPSAATPAPAPPGSSPGVRPRLLEEAQRAELAGDLVRAAELLEAAGELGGAGRLYERAAAQARS